MGLSLQVFSYLHCLVLLVLELQIQAVSYGGYNADVFFGENRCKLGIENPIMLDLGEAIFFVLGAPSDILFSSKLFTN